MLRSLRAFVARNRTDLLSIGALAGWPLVYFWQATLRQAVFIFGDILLFFYPTHLSYANALREGRLPLWEPRMLAGFPLYAEGQIGALYPTHPFLYGLLPIDVATNYDILLNLAWVAVGMYAFLRVLKLRPASAFLGALAFGFGGFFIARIEHMSILATASWLPWNFWAFEKHEQETNPKRRWRWWVVLAVFTGIQLLGGHPQFAFMTAVLLSIYAVVNWKRDVRESRFPLENLILTIVQKSPGIPRRLILWLFEYFTPWRVLVIVIAMGLGALIAAPQLLPTFELSTLSDRATGLLPKFFNAFSLRLVHYIMLFIPFILGNPYPRVSVEVIGYIGFLPVVLAIAAPFVQRNRRAFFFLAIALVALFLGLGDQNAFYRGLRYLPLFNYFRVPSRFLFWYSFAAATLAALTFDYLIARAQVTVRFTRGQKIVLAIFALLIGVVVGLVPSQSLDFWLSVWTWLPGVLLLVTIWILLGARRGLFTRKTLGAIAIGLTVVDLGLFASVFTKTYDEMVSVTDFYKPPSTVSIVNDLTLQEGRALTSLWIYPVMVTMRESLYPNVFMSYNIPNAIGYTPLLPLRTSQYLEELTAPMMDLLNVKYYIMPQMLPTDAKTEGQDTTNGFEPEYLTHFSTFTPTTSVKLKVVSSIAQSVNLKTGAVVAQIGLVTQDGKWFTMPLRAGVDTAEWAYDRTDVKKVIQHARPAIATTYPARSAFPTESHAGHAYLAEFDITQNGQPVDVNGIIILPQILPGLVRIEKVSFVMPDGKEVTLAQLTGKSDQTLIYRTNEVAVFRNEDYLPRAFLVHHAKLADDETTLDELVNDTFKPAQILFLADGTPLNTGDAQRADESVRITSYQPERITLSVQAQSDAYVLLTDTWYPGWVARVDGVETPIQRGDYIFRAVRVSAGAHQIEFEYRPTTLYIGAVISLVVLVFLGAVWVMNR
ncbi:MAG: YfhO family protein [Chloroflexi bacterium]|nr:YfhO family protein [Chloroflexota bacterium]